MSKLRWSPKNFAAPPDWLASRDMRRRRHNWTAVLYFASAALVARQTGLSTQLQQGWLHAGASSTRDVAVWRKGSPSDDAATAQSTEPARLKLWLDLRFKDPADMANRAAAAGGKYEQPKWLVDGVPVVQSALQELFDGVKKQLERFRMELPKGPGLDGVLVDQNVAAVVLKQAEPLGIDVFYTSADEAGGAETPNGDKVIAFVRNANTGEMVGGLLASAAVAFQTGAAREVKEICPLSALSTSPVDLDGDALGADATATVAKSLPLDALLWATALMRTRGKGSAASYSLPSDRGA